MIRVSFRARARARAPRVVIVTIYFHTMDLDDARSFEMVLDSVMDIMIRTSLFYLVFAFDLLFWPQGTYWHAYDFCRFC